MTLPSPRLQKKILKAFRRATLSSPWWKRNKSGLRFCPRCGGPLRRRFVRAEGRRRLVCGRCGGITYENPQVVAACLPVRRGKIWLLRRDIEPSRGLWTFPAGYMELGETVAQAAARETREEICCRVELAGLQGIYSYPDSGVVTVVFRGRVRGPDPTPGAESQCVQAFRPSDIPWDELAFRSTFHALRDWASGE